MQTWVIFAQTPVTYSPTDFSFRKHSIGGPQGEPEKQNAKFFDQNEKSFLSCHP